MYLIKAVTLTLLEMSLRTLCKITSFCAISHSIRMNSTHVFHFSRLSDFPPKQSEPDHQLNWFLLFRIQTVQITSKAFPQVYSTFRTLYFLSQQKFKNVNYLVTNLIHSIDLRVWLFCWNAVNYTTEHLLNSLFNNLAHLA